MDLINLEPMTYMKGQQITLTPQGTTSEHKKYI
jgi:hypothetical protein